MNWLLAPCLGAAWENRLKDFPEKQDEGDSGLGRREAQRDDIHSEFKEKIKLNLFCFFPETVHWEQIYVVPGDFHVP